MQDYFNKRHTIYDRGVKNMTFNNVQNVIKKMGEKGCFYLCYLRIAERFLKKRLDVVEKAVENIAAGNIFFDYNDINNPNQFYVVDGAKLLKNLTGKNWKVTKETKDFKPEDEYFFKVYICSGKDGAAYYHAEKDDFLPLVPSAKDKGFKVDSLRVCVLC